MIVGTGDFTYEVAEGWGSFPEGWKLGWIAAVAVDSRDRVYLYNRSEHPLVVLDRDGSFSSSWAEDILLDAHGILIDERDHVFCVEREIHCMRRFSPAGELTMTLGTPRKQGAEGEPFRQPTDIAFDSKGDMYISDGYDNARVHKFTADGEHIKSWGSPGAGPGQFDTPHCVRVDRNDRVLVCDRSNNRVQIFDTEGEFLSEWGKSQSARHDPYRPGRHRLHRRARSAREHIEPRGRTAVSLGQGRETGRARRIPRMPPRDLDRQPWRPLRQ